MTIAGFILFGMAVLALATVISAIYGIVRLGVSLIRRGGA